MKLFKFFVKINKFCKPPNKFNKNIFFRFIIKKSMIILTTATTPQTLKFIARENCVDSIVLRDEQNNTSTTVNQAFSLIGYYMSADIKFTLTEGKFYELTAYNGSTVVYRDKIFCTDQTDYSINNGQYTEHESTNEYITV